MGGGSGRGELEQWWKSPDFWFPICWLVCNWLDFRHNFGRYEITSTLFSLARILKFVPSHCGMLTFFCSSWMWLCTGKHTLTTFHKTGEINDFQTGLNRLGGCLNGYPEHSNGLTTAVWMGYWILWTGCLAVQMGWWILRAGYPVVRTGWWVLLMGSWTVRRAYENFGMDSRAIHKVRKKIVMIAWPQTAFL